MKVASLFTGIGGIELGLSRGGFETKLICEVDPYALGILRERFPDVRVSTDVRDLTALPNVDIVTAGFPCQDLSQAGTKKGLSGTQSSLIDHVFRLLSGKRHPPWIVMENVPYMLRLHRGHFMASLVDRLEEAGYKWAYRVVDARCFGVPQRRPRVLLVAGFNGADPRSILFPDHGATAVPEPRPSDVDESQTYGFYWTEGSRGVGWAKNAVPPIKGGSGLGIPSPPAIWVPRDDFVGTIDIRDAERLQGFPQNWTRMETDVPVRPGVRWKLIGNAVCVPVAKWLGARLNARQNGHIATTDVAIPRERWPVAAWGEKGKAWAVSASTWPLLPRETPIGPFLKHELKPLSRRATEGFISRARTCTNVVYSKRFLSSLQRHARLN